MRNGGEVCQPTTWRRGRFPAQQGTWKQSLSLIISNLWQQRYGSFSNSTKRRFIIYSWNLFWGGQFFLPAAFYQPLFTSRKAGQHVELVQQEVETFSFLKKFLKIFRQIFWNFFRKNSKKNFIWINSRNSREKHREFGIKNFSLGSSELVIVAEEARVASFEMSGLYSRDFTWLGPWTLAIPFRPARLGRPRWSWLGPRCHATRLGCPGQDQSSSTQKLAQRPEGTYKITFTM